MRDGKQTEEADGAAVVVAHVAGGVDDTLAPSEETGHENDNEIEIGNAAWTVAMEAEDHNGKKRQECSGRLGCIHCAQNEAE